MAIEHLATFIAYLSLLGYAPSTMVSYVSAIGYVHRLARVPDPSSTFLVQKILSGASKLAPSADSRLPITTPILSRMVNSVPITVSNSYNQLLLQAMLVVAFHGLMRVGEITSSASQTPSVLLDQVSFTSTTVTITITVFKHNLSRRPLDIVMPAQDDPSVCPVRALAQYINLRGYAPGPLFCFPNGSPVSRSFFTSQLKAAIVYIGFNPAFYKSHSLRIGGASHYAELGYSDSQIRLLGRWKSDAFKKYIRSQRIHL